MFRVVGDFRAALLTLVALLLGAPSLAQQVRNHTTFGGYTYYTHGGGGFDSSPEAACTRYATKWKWNAGDYSVKVEQLKPGFWHCQRYYQGQIDENNYAPIYVDCQPNAHQIVTGKYWSHAWWDSDVGACFCEDPWYFDETVQWCTSGTQCASPFTLASDGSRCEAYCSEEESWDSITSRCVAMPEVKTCATQSDHPIDFSRGRKYRTENVISVGKRFPLTLKYRYNNHNNHELTASGLIPNESAPRKLASVRSHVTYAEYRTFFAGSGLPRDASLTDPNQHLVGIDRYWRHDFDEILQRWGAEFILHSNDGQKVTFAGINTTAAAYPNVRLEAANILEDGVEGYRVINTTTSETKLFDRHGRLVVVQKISDKILLTYDQEGRLESVANGEGASLRFYYAKFPTNSIYSVGESSSSYPVKVESNAGQHVILDWNHSFRGKTATSHLISFISDPTITTPVTGRSFAYNESRWPASITDIFNVIDAASGIKNHYAHFEYDDIGRAIYSGLEGGFEAQRVQYPDKDTRIITNALQKDAEYKFSDIGGVRRLHTVTGKPTQNCLKTEVRYSYDNAGNLIEKFENGTVTTYQYDDRNREVSRTESAGTAEVRTIRTEYHPALDLPLRIVESNQVTVMQYDANGRLLSRTVQHAGATTSNSTSSN